MGLYIIFYLGIGLFFHTWFELLDVYKDMSENPPKDIPYFLKYEKMNYDTPAYKIYVITLWPVEIVFGLLDMLYNSVIGGRN